MWVQKAAAGAAFLLCAVPAALAADRYLDGRDWLIHVAAPQGFVAADIGAGGNRLVARLRLRQVAPVLHVYIEGDGAAWPNAYRPPSDPTPENSPVWGMVTADPAPAVAYLGRPCQYLDTSALVDCPLAYWTDARYSPAVLGMMGVAVDALKQQSGAQQVSLIGYSGGGVIAALLAAARDDVVGLTTVAAPLDLAAWLDYHGLTPLTLSLDPARVAEQAQVPAQYRAVHWMGGRDKVVPVQTNESYVQRNGAQLRVVPEFDHQCCWARDWQHLLETEP